MPAPGSGQGSLRIEALPQPHSPLTLDLQALSRGFDADSDLRAEIAPLGFAHDRLLIFVSLAMPEPTLVRLMEQAAQAGATLVLRGLFRESLRETVSRLHRLMANRRVAVLIDPEAFDRYGVGVTPTFVLVRSTPSESACSQAACRSAQSHAKVAGDVSLDHAMKYLQESLERTAPKPGVDPRSR